MLREDEYFQDLSQEELWQRYCGFLDLSLGEFMEIQENLLMQEINLVAYSLLGKKIMGNVKPESVDEFRRLVPLTTYEDYEPYLSEQREDALAVKPADWCHSSGRGGEFKWIPYTSDFLEVTARIFISYMILSAASRKGEVRIKPGERVLMTVPPRPYASGSLGYYASQVFSVKIIPPLEEGAQMEFQERIQKGFGIALRSGVDVIASIASVMVKVGERMSEEAQGIKFSRGILQPKIMFTLARAWLISKLKKRLMLPKDLWRPKGIITGGTDTSIYKDSLAYYWGKTPFELYCATEIPAIAVNNWNKKWLTFVPYSAFWEFIPYEESIKAEEDNSYNPSTVLLNELEEGKLYEVVLSQFYGMPLLRYRMRDIIKVMSLSDDETGVNIPQVVFHTRIGETIDIAGLTRLTERVIWESIANTGIKYEDWSARKEYDHDKTFLHVYIELREEKKVAELEDLVDKHLRMVDIDYRDIDSYLGLKPIKITLLSRGTFGRYYQEKVKEGADLAHLKPSHMNAHDSVIQRLLQLSI
ncbi:GH3 auxin-responsive promoter family protein [Chloroflexota bacterium]